MTTGKKLQMLVPLLVAAGGLAALLVWTRQKPNVPVVLRVPGADGTPVAAATGKPAANLRCRLEKGPGQPGATRGAWPGFRGPNHDGLTTEKAGLATAWGKDGPPLLWQLPVGEGYAGAAVLDGRAYLLDYDATNGADVVRCLSFDDGREIWRCSYPVKIKRNHGMSRTVPAVTDRYVLTIGPKCQVLCLDAVTGRFRWSMDLVRQFNTKVPPWYAGQCPLIDGDRAILAPGGDGLMIAVDCATGAIAWTTPNPRAWNMTHSSITPAAFNGRRMYVYCGSGGVAGVSADDGSIMWDTTDWKISIATVPSPVDLGNGRIFLSGGYDSGCMMLQLEEKDGGIRPRILWRLPAKDFGATQQTPILYGGHIYGIRPDGQMACLTAEGKIAWTSGSAARFGLGPMLIAEGLIYAMDDNGLLTLARATPDAFAPLAHAQVLHGHECWGPLALAGGRLIARDLTRMVCLDVTGGTENK